MYVPEAIGGVVDGTREAALRREVGGERGRQGLGTRARIVGKLDRDRLAVPIGYRVVQTLDGALRLDALVEAHKAHTFRHGRRQRSIRGRLVLHYLLYAMATTI